jgi:hypothetical protein
MRVCLPARFSAPRGAKSSGNHGSAVATPNLSYTENTSFQNSFGEMFLGSFPFAPSAGRELIERTFRDLRL